MTGLLSRLVLSIGLFLSNVCEIYAYAIWHPVDVQSVICTGSPKQTVISIEHKDIPAADLTVPHILTFYRTFDKPATLLFKGSDESGRLVVGGTQSLGAVHSLMSLSLAEVPAKAACVDSTTPCSGARRLGALQIRKPQPIEDRQLQEVDANDIHHDVSADDLVEPEEEEAEELQEEEADSEPEPGDEEAADPAAARLLKSSGRSGRSSSSRSGKSSSSSKPTFSKPPTYTKSVPSKGTDAASYSNARRRANPVTARRRGTPTPTGLRRRISSPVDGKTHGNPVSPTAGNYGYASQSKINSNYPGGYSSSSYGYTGKNAHKPGGNTKLIMAAAAGGAVAGVGAYYVASRWGRSGWGWRDRDCTHSNGYSGNCAKCYEKYDDCQSVEARGASRDDIMATGFIPKDYALPTMTFPLNITIYQIEGEDFKSGVCPPDGWDGKLDSGVFTPKKPQPDLWLTLTPMMELEEPLTDDVTHHYASSSLPIHGHIFILFLLYLHGLRFFR